MLEVGVVRFQRVFEIRWLSLGNIGDGRYARGWRCPFPAGIRDSLAEPGKHCRSVDKELPASDGCPRRVCCDMRPNSDR